MICNKKANQLGSYIINNIGNNIGATTERCVHGSRLWSWMRAWAQCPFVDNVFFCTISPCLFWCRLCFNWHDIKPVFASSPCWQCILLHFFTVPLFDGVCVLIDMTSYRFLHRPLVDDFFIVPLLTMFFICICFTLRFWCRFSLSCWRVFCLSPHDVWLLSVFVILTISFSLFLSMSFLCICFRVRFLCRLSARSLMNNTFSVWHYILFFIALDDYYFWHWYPQWFFQYHLFMTTGVLFVFTLACRYSWYILG